ncbi:hypothetical protein CN311_00500 [Mesorhizobium sanjuanii]|uniref:Uncharacterized protein n=1 Tax=Mesorhizobium sanjuanii TaxID=2037900 RepID=A0A2A6FMJ7_9HYPH|nr:hypothetical protein [Mesorhizobium sanjuanii]PDQ22972.1 hypothetical protein CN311_00500 [Mesorhizobium sanjuanii]
MDGTANSRAEQAVLRYVATARPVQQLVSETLTQVAGFALLQMTSPRRAVLAEGALAGAQEAATRAAEEVRALAVPEVATHHHHHLHGAAETLLRACVAALESRRIDASEQSDALVRALRASSDHLRATACLLPGFELVDFGQACCAAHAPRRLLQGVT